MKPKIGMFVKFKDNLWGNKKEIAIGGGLFGPPMSPDHENKFKIKMVNNQGTDEEPDFELGLEDYPWLVYFDEMEIVNETKTKNN